MGVQSSGTTYANMMQIFNEFSQLQSLRAPQWLCNVNQKQKFLDPIRFMDSNLAGVWKISSICQYNQRNIWHNNVCENHTIINGFSAKCVVFASMFFLWTRVCGVLAWYKMISITRKLKCHAISWKALWEQRYHRHTVKWYRQQLVCSFQNKKKVTIDFRRKFLGYCPATPL